MIFLAKDPLLNPTMNAIADALAARLIALQPVTVSKEQGYTLVAKGKAIGSSDLAVNGDFVIHISKNGKEICTIERTSGDTLNLAPSDIPEDLKQALIWSLQNMNIQAMRSD